MSEPAPSDSEQETAPVPVAPPRKRLVVLALLVSVLLFLLLPLLYLSLTGRLGGELEEEQALGWARLLASLAAVTQLGCFLLNASCLQGTWEGKERLIRFTFRWVGLLLFLCLAALMWTGHGGFRFGGLATMIFCVLAMACGWAIVKGVSILIVAWLGRR